MSTCLDILGVGFGPSNLALAIALQERQTEAKVRFLESRDAPAWQPGMLLDGSDIQNNPIRDLVSLRNPRSRYTFINYLFETGKLIEHLNLPTRFPLRKEYAAYIKWVARHFDHVVDYGRRVDEIAVVDFEGAPAYRVTTGSGHEYHARSLVLAPGRTPYVPAPFDSLDSKRVFHLTDYLFKIDELTSNGAPTAMAVIGGSQSAVELTLDLSRRFPEAQVSNYLRSYALRLKDTSPFSEESFFPEYMEYYFNSSREQKKILDANVGPTNYSSADGDVLERLYLQIHEERLDGKPRTQVLGNRVPVTVTEENDHVIAEFAEVHRGNREIVKFDFIVLATGFRDLGPGVTHEPFPALLEGVIDKFRFEDGHLVVNENFALDATNPGLPPVYLNGLCESSHGIGDGGSLSLLSLRSERIAINIVDELKLRS